MSLEINYIDAPEGAQEKMTAVGEYGNALSDISLIPAGVRDIPYATLEPGIWKLDGTMRILPDDPKPGWWSRERNGTGSDVGILGVSLLGEFILGEMATAQTKAGNRFQIPPKITVSFPTPYGSTGFTFTFSPSTQQWCSEMRARWYNGQTLLIDKVYYPDSARWELSETVDSFDRVEFEFLATNKPGCFVKVQKIEIGRTVLFGAEEIVSARLINEVDPTLCKIPVDTISFDMHDAHNRSFLPQENQRIELIKDGKIRAVQYIKSSTRKTGKDYTIRCQSCIGLLNDEFLGGLYHEKPVKELLVEILGEWEFELAPNFEKKTVNGYIPVCTQREALQQVAFAIGAMITTQDSSKIRLLPVPTAVSSRFTESEIIIGGSVKSASRYAKVEIVSHSYTKSEVSETLINEEEIDGENVLITFTAPHYDYEISGGEITEAADNWVKITAAGPVTLTAKTYSHNTQSHAKRNPEATAKERGNFLAVKEATLINTGNVYEALDRLYSAVQRRQTVSQPVIVKNQTAGQMASSITAWVTIARGFISSMNSVMTQNGHVADIQIQGIEVALDSVWFYSGEIYSGGQEVVY